MNLSKLMQEAWSLQVTHRGLFQKGVAVMIVVFYLLVTIANYYTQTNGINLLEPKAIRILKVVCSLFIAPVHFSLVMFGIEQSVGVKPVRENLFRYIKIAPMLLLYTVVIELMVYLGSVLFVLLGLYIMIATSYTIPLILHKKYSLHIALMTSIKVVSKHWKIFILCHLLYFLLLLVGMFTLFIGYFWIGPFYYTINGILYREAFGLAQNPMDSTLKAQDETIFLP